MSEQAQSLPIRRIKRKDGSFAVTVVKVKGKNSERLGVYPDASKCIKAFKELIDTGNYHDAEA